MTANESHPAVEGVKRALEPPVSDSVTCGGEPSSRGCGAAATPVARTTLLCGECRGHGVVLHHFACSDHAAAVKRWGEAVQADTYGPEFHRTMAAVQSSPVTTVERHFITEPY